VEDSSRTIVNTYNPATLISVMFEALVNLYLNLFAQKARRPYKYSPFLREGHTIEKSRHTDRITVNLMFTVHMLTSMIHCPMSFHRLYI